MKNLISQSVSVFGDFDQVIAVLSKYRLVVVVPDGDYHEFLTWF